MILLSQLSKDETMFRSTSTFIRASATPKLTNHRASFNKMSHRCDVSVGVRVRKGNGDFRRVLASACLYMVRSQYMDVT